MPEVRLSTSTVRFEERGSGPPLVFVHGLLVNGSLWREVTPLLEASARCIVPDWPLGSHEIPMDRDADRSAAGHSRLLGEFIEALDLEDATLVGNDSGGAIVQMLAAELPERVGRIVLTPCDCFEVFPPAMFKPLQLAAKVPGLLTVAAQPLRLRALQRAPFGYGWLAKRPIPGDLLADWTAGFFANQGVRRDATGFLRTADPAQTLEAAARLAAFDKPALVAWAADDRFFAPDLGRRLAQVLPQGRLEVIEDARTFVSLDQPARLAELIREFALT